MGKMRTAKKWGGAKRALALPYKGGGREKIKKRGGEVLTP
jgi:hypothetical protein